MLALQSQQAQLNIWASYAFLKSVLHPRVAQLSSSMVMPSDEEGGCPGTLEGRVSVWCRSGSASLPPAFITDGAK